MTIKSALRRIQDIADNSNNIFLCRIDDGVENTTNIRRLNMGPREWDWDSLIDELDSSLPRNDGSGHIIKEIFIGTVMNLSPSGKYYTPFASSHVTSDEAKKDEVWYEELDESADSRGCFIREGRGDPCDLFLCKVVENIKHDEKFCPQCDQIFDEEDVDIDCDHCGTELE